MDHSSHLPWSHGSPAGFEHGCVTAALCPQHGSAEFLTCAEAWVRRRGDLQTARLPIGLRVPRGILVDDRTQSDGRMPIHGTQWGYSRGCRSARDCPNRRLGRMTCQEARQRYFSGYVERRRAGRGRPIDHGTQRGYSAGCRDACPAPEGRTCRDAWRAYRRQYDRARGVRPAEPPLEPGDAATLVRGWVDAGHSIRSISMRTGVGRTTIAELARYEEDGNRVRLFFTPRTLQRVRETLSPPVPTDRQGVDAHEEVSR